jgi:NAD-dependent DNA ligase
MARRIYVLRRSSKLGAHGQPNLQQWNAPRIAYRAIDELIGICKGLISDQRLSEEEILFLTGWLNANQQAADVWPANALISRINQILDDKIIMAEERDDLLILLREIVGQANNAGTTNNSTELPLTKPAPPVFFTGHRFCLTGRFMLGQRANVEYEIRERGGLIEATVTAETNFLVIGEIGSRDWLHSTHGRKIEKAISYAERGHPIAIISEEHWADHLL